MKPLLPPTSRRNKLSQNITIRKGGTKVNIGNNVEDRNFAEHNSRSYPRSYQRFVNS